MTMKVLTARRFPRWVNLAIHLDTTKTIVVDAKTIPDPVYVISQTWTLPLKGAGEATAAYNTRLLSWFTGVQNDMKATADARLADLVDAASPGIALPIEGVTF